MSLGGMKGYLCTAQNMLGILHFDVIANEVWQSHKADGINWKCHCERSVAIS